VRERVVSAPIRGLPLELRELGPSYRTRDPDGVEQWLAISHAAGEPPVSARQRMSLQITLPMLERLVVFGEADHCVHWEMPDQWNAAVPFADRLRRYDATALGYSSRTASGSGCWTG
jgi:hypothetical protein